MLAAVISLALITAAPAPKIHHRVFAVSGRDDEWKVLDVSVAAGDIVLVTARGKVKVGSWTGEVGPAGSEGKGLGRLEMKVGGEPVAVGNRLYWVSDGPSGPLKFRVYDTKYSDNEGSFALDVVVVPAALIPDAAEETAKK